jgi:hypothetical protein
MQTVGEGVLWMHIDAKGHEEEQFPMREFWSVRIQTIRFFRLEIHSLG